MAYTSRNLRRIANGYYEYVTNDSLVEVQAADYFADFVNIHGGGLNDYILVGDGIVFGGAIPNQVTLQVSAVNGNAATAGLIAGELLPELSGTFVIALGGQSNMVGRAAYDSGARYPAGTRQWTQAGALADVGTATMLDHVPDIDLNEMGLTIQFAIDFKTRYPNADLVFVPCADGSTGFSPSAGEQWGVGNPLSDAMIARTNACLAANPSFEFLGILWHQGEADSGFAGYEAALDAQLAAFRSNITGATSTTPIVLGELGVFNLDSPGRIAVNDSIKGAATRLSNVEVASAVLPTELTDFDTLHFDAASLRLFGSRYFEMFQVARLTAPAVPLAPLNLEVTAGDTQNTLTWVPFNDRGAAITDYVIEVSTGGAYQVITDGVGTGTTYIHTGLTNGTQYTYRIRAVNSVGQSAPSTTASGTPATITKAFVNSFDFASDDTDLTTYTFEVDVTTATPVVSIYFRAGGSRTIDSVTIGGETATAQGPLYNPSGTPGTNQQAQQWWYASGVTPGTVDVVVTLSGSAQRAGVDVWSVENGDFASLTNNGGGGTTSSGSVTLDINTTDEGLLLACAGTLGSSTTLTWTGVTERKAWTVFESNGTGCADFEVTAAETPRAVSVATTDTTSYNAAILHIPAL